MDGGQHEASKCIHGGYAFIVPIIQDFAFLHLEPIQIGIPLKDALSAENIRVVFVEPFLNRRTAETVARNTGAAVLDVSQFPGGVKGTEGGYIQMMDYLVNSFAKAFGEKK